MKCDELKDYDYDPDFPFQSRGRFYVADEVEAAIDELKAKLEDAKATAYAESVDAGMRERRLKRALWLARAEMAKWKSLYYWYAISDKYKSRKFDEVERKCRAKAEEFK